jgi:glycosyltransferase involved in cell wall biosynthesis
MFLGCVQPPPSVLERCAVIVPAYNEAAVIREVVEGIRAVFPLVVVVDDGSADATAAEARAAGGTVVRHAVNIGQGGAVETGVRYALRRGAEWFVTMDGDGQHAPADALALVQRLGERRGEIDIVLGSRFLQPGSNMSRGRRVLLRTAAWLSRRLHGLDLTDAHNGLRAFTRGVAERLRFNHVDMAHASELYDIIQRHGFRWEERPVTVRYTRYSKGKGQPVLNAVNILVDFLFHRVK